jgi:hypothetical protein
MKTTAEIFLSRNFVEFGPFTSEEMSGFAARGILLEGDFVKSNGADSWQPCIDWLSTINTPAPKTPAKKKTAKPKAKA